MASSNVPNPERNSNLLYAVAELQERGLNPVEQSDGQYLARCPTHDDRNPSLSVTERDGKLLVNCQVDNYRALQRKDEKRLQDALAQHGLVSVQGPRSEDGTRPYLWTLPAD